MKHPSKPENNPIRAKEEASVSSRYVPMRKAKVTVLWGYRRPDADQVAIGVPETALGSIMLFQENLGGVSTLKLNSNREYEHIYRGENGIREVVGPSSGKTVHQCTGQAKLKSGARRL